MALVGASCDALVSLSLASRAISTQAELVKRLNCTDLNSSSSPQKTLSQPAIFTSNPIVVPWASVHSALFLRVKLPS